MSQAFPTPSGNIPLPLPRPSSFGRPDAVWQASSAPLPGDLPPLPEGFKLDTQVDEVDASDAEALALRKLSLEEISMLGKVARQFSNIQSLINTRMNPAFVPVNFIRDVQTGSALLLDEGFSVKDVAKVSANIPKAWGALWRQSRGRPGDGKWDKLLDDFVSAGGKISFDQFNTVEQTLAKIKTDMLDRSGGRSAPLRAWKSFIKVIEDLNDTVENGFRLAAFAAARDKGRSLKNAAFMARDLTVDFQKKGDWGGELSSWYVFANASIQGNYNLAKRLAKSRSVKAVAAGMILGGFAQHVWNSMMAGDDDDGENVYKKMLRNEPYKLERQMVFFLPGSKQYVSFPLAYGLNVFWNLGTQGGAVTSGDVKVLPALIDSARVAFEAFNPIGSGSVASMAAPTMADPFLDILVNENFFGAPIYPKSSPFDPSPAPNSHQAFKSTHPFFTWSAEKLNSLTGGDDVQPGYVDIHPDSMEHLWMTVKYEAREAAKSAEQKRADEIAALRLEVLRIEATPFRMRLDNDRYDRLQQQISALQRAA